MHLSQFSYHLPGSLIAQAPAVTRDGSRLLRVAAERCEHWNFTDFPKLVRPGDLLIINDTRVIKARLRGEKDSGGQAELLIERVETDDQALCQVRVSKPLKPGRLVVIGDPGAGPRLEVLARVGQFYRLRFPGGVLSTIERYGEMPLPPYIQRPDTAEDSERYQTVYADNPGAVAAPTAGLHFTHELLERVAQRDVDIQRVTLHVGAGTFQPVRVDDLSTHRMHAEPYHIPAQTSRAIEDCRRRGGRIVAIGTTVVRALESAVGGDGEVNPGDGETSLFITPGYDFRTVDALLTNFHLPQSTLLMLVCAFAGYERVMAAYGTAVEHGYRFFSYGDACFFERASATGGALE